VTARSTDPIPFRRGGAGREGALDDAALLARVVRRDPTAFRALLDRHLTVVVTTARRILAEPTEADDVAQETMLRLWTTAAKLDLGPFGLRPWLRRVATNLAIDRVRSRRREVVTDDVPEVEVPPSQQAGLDSGDLTARVNQALSLLPERQRLAITLFHYEGLSQSEVGQALGVSDEAVESLLARARRALKTSLKTEWTELLEAT
jgi:RNA polymerase sigma-70 factor (ECF subfamily)